MIVIQIFIGTIELTPPQTKPSSELSLGEIGIQNHPIDAIIITFQKLTVQSAQLVRHGGLSSESRTVLRSVTGMRLRVQTLRQGCPAGASFSERSLRKSRATFRRRIQGLSRVFSQGIAQSPCVAEHSSRTAATGRTLPIGAVSF